MAQETEPAYNLTAGTKQWMYGSAHIASFRPAVVSSGRKRSSAGQTPLRQFSSNSQAGKIWVPLAVCRFFSLSRGSTVSAPCQDNLIFAFSVTVVISSFIVNVCVIGST